MSIHGFYDFLQTIVPEINLILATGYYCFVIKDIDTINCSLLFIIPKRLQGAACPY